MPQADMVLVESGVERIENVALDFWSRPWAFATRQSTMAPLVTLDNRFRNKSGPMPIVLDDGRPGTLTVEARPCNPAVADCDRLADCGCFAIDSYGSTSPTPRGEQWRSCTCGLPTAASSWRRSIWWTDPARSS
jgi:hypothetical protein